MADLYARSCKTFRISDFRHLETSLAILEERTLSLRAERGVTLDPKYTQSSAIVFRRSRKIAVCPGTAATRAGDRAAGLASGG